MKMNEYRSFLVHRLAKFRIDAGLSAREFSMRLGKSEAYIAKFEQGDINMPSEVLLDALKILGVSKEKFFSLYPDDFESDNAVLEDFKALSDKNKELVKALISALK